jgi:hypothetical protein
MVLHVISEGGKIDPYTPRHLDKAGTDTVLPWEQ